ncbi:MAG TPA: DUF748 domain-containing protein [Tepidisphaeraceae bacterium]|jgi:hypothetical protein|nr:DUF748 domain-containing protein [Tepidisphaeraceae bacterium]
MTETKEKKEKRPGRWRRRTIAALIIFIVLALILRVAVNLVLPVVLNKVARSYKLTCQYDRLELSLLGADAAIYNLEFLPEGGGDPVIRMDYCQGDLSLFNLFRGRLVVYRVAADGVDLTIERTPDGRFPLLAKFTSPNSGAPKVSAAPTNSPPQPIDLNPPLRIDAIRLEHVRARFHDEFIHPELDARLALDVRLSDVGVPGRPTRFELDFSSDPVLDSLEVDGESRGDGKTLDATLHVLMRGLHLKPVQPYLQIVGFRATADNISASMSGELKASVAPNPADGIEAALSLQQAYVRADEKEALAMDHLSLNATALNTALAKLGKLEIDGVRCTAEKSAEGVLGAAGIELAPPTVAAIRAEPPAPPPAPQPAAVAGATFHWTLDEFSLRHFHAGFHDRSVSPPVDLSLSIPELSAANLVSAPDRADAAVHFAATIESPGMVRVMHILGQARPFAAEKTFNATVSAEGIAPAAIKPYLDSAGLESEWKNGSFTCAADGDLAIDQQGKLSADARVRGMQLADGVERFRFDNISLNGISFDPRADAIGAESIEFSGPDLAATRDASGHWHVLGFKTEPRVPSAAPVVTSAEAASDPPSMALPKIRIGKFLWKDIHLSLHDDSVSPAANVTISDAGVEVDDLNLDVSDSAPEERPGKIRAWLVVPKIARINVDGSVTSRPREVSSEIDVKGEDIHLDPLAQYLKQAGCEPAMRDGQFRINAQVSAAGDDHSIATSAAFSVNYRDGDTPLVSLKSARIAGLRMQSGRISVDSIQIRSPWARAVRDADGRVEVAGIRLVGKPAMATERVDPPSRPQQSADPAPAIIATVKSLNVENAAIDWVDHSVTPAVATTARINASLNDFTSAPDAPAASLRLNANVAGSLDALTADGTVSASADQQSLRMEVSADGIGGGSLTSYLPPNIQVALHGGRLRAGILATAAVNPRGGKSVEIDVANLDYRDASQKEPYLKFDSFHAGVGRLDSAASVVAVEDVSLRGLEANAQKTSRGLELLGLRIGQEAAEKSDPLPVPSPAADPPGTPPANDLAHVAQRLNKYPLVTLDSLDLNVRKITVSDQTQARAVPIVVSNVRLHNLARLVWLGRDPEENPPTQLELTGRVDPIVDQFDLETRATPFFRTKTVAVDLTVTGIHGQGITEIDPSLSRQMDGSALKDGQFHASASLAIKLNTLDPANFDFSRGGKMDVSLKDIAFRAEPAGPVLAGLGDVQSEGIIIAPRMAGMDIHELDVDNIVGKVWRSDDGLHVLGLVITPQVKTPTPSLQGPAKAPAADPPATDPPENDPPENEIKIERLLVSGMDFVAEDRTVDPPLIVPINGLDMEVQDISNLSPREDKPVKFSVDVSAAKVALPAQDTGPAGERELFSEVTANGAVSMYPQLNGWAKASVSGFELTSLKALAALHKVTLGAGTFDGDVDIRFLGDGGIDTSTKLVLTDLSLSEPANGWIRRTLKLPAPLDVVIAALQDQDGSITIPVNLTIRGNSVSTAQLAAAGSGALLSIISTSLAAAPLKVGNLLGLDEKGAQHEPPVIVSFLPGYSFPREIDQLDLLAQRMKDNDSLNAILRHDLGSDDIALMSERVNPSPADALAVADRLGQQKAALLSARRQAAGDVRAMLASGGGDSADIAIERLRRLDRELAETENALDRTYDLLRPGADRQADGRTRAACLAVARARLQAVRDFLLADQNEKGLADRIHIANPRYSPVTDSSLGRVIITLIKKK